MAIKPILFNSPMVRALLAEQKTQTRRLVKPQPVQGHGAGDNHDYYEGNAWLGCNLDAHLVKTAPCQPGDIVDAQDESGASFATLRVTDVRVERVQEITEHGAVAEGCYSMDPLSEFEDLWDSLYPGSWDRNDWVWVYEFKVIRANVDEVGQ